MAVYCAMCTEEMNSLKAKYTVVNVNAVGRYRYHCDIKD